MYSRRVSKIWQLLTLPAQRYNHATLFIPRDSTTITEYPQSDNICWTAGQVAGNQCIEASWSENDSTELTLAKAGLQGGYSWKLFWKLGLHTAFCTEIGGLSVGDFDCIHGQSFNFLLNTCLIFNTNALMVKTYVNGNISWFSSALKRWTFKRQDNISFVFSVISGHLFTVPFFKKKQVKIN